MATLTIEVPDRLAEQLTQQQDRLDEIIGLGLRELSPVPNRVYRYILAFLAGNPSDEEIVGFRPLPGMQERLRVLLERNKEGMLTRAEETELDEYERIEHLMVLLKVQSLPFPSHKLAR